MSQAADVADERRDARSAHWVAAGILMSRVAGLVRERVFAHYFGMGAAADVFRTALRMPNVLQNLLGEGVMSASFIPVYSELLAEGREEEAGRVAGAIFALLLAIAGGLALVGVFLAPVLVTVFAPGFSGYRYELTVAVVRIIFPMTGVLVLYAWALGILNSHRRFFAAYVAPVLWSAAMIATMVLLGGRLDMTRLTIALAWGALIGGLLQFGFLLPWVARLERSLEIRWDLKLAGVREAVRNAGPAILGRGVVQLGSYLDMFLASFLAIGAPAALGYAQTLYVLPVSLFGMAVAAAELPELSRRRGDAAAVLQGRVNDGLRQMAFYVVPSVVGYLLLGDLIVAALYQTGEFGPSAVLLAYLVLGGYTLGLLASTGTRLFSSAFFALRDTRTPAKFAFVRVVVAGALGVALMLYLQNFEVAGRPLGAVGLGVASGGAAWLEWVLLRRSLRRRMGAVGFPRGPLLRMAAAALLAAAAAVAVRLLLPVLHPVPAAAAVLGVYGVAYMGLAKLFGLEEVNDLAGRLTGRRSD